MSQDTINLKTIERAIKETIEEVSRVLAGTSFPLYSKLCTLFCIPESRLSRIAIYCMEFAIFRNSSKSRIAKRMINKKIKKERTDPAAFTINARMIPSVIFP